jgi:hypothetical protein
VGLVRKRRSATYVEPTTLGDLRQIVTDHDRWPDHTRVWLHHNPPENGNPSWFSVEISHAEEFK